MEPQGFTNSFIKWAESQNDIQAVGLVGSYAHGTSSPKSDIDVVIISETYDHYLQDQGWVEQFGKVIRTTKEDYGKVKTLRVYYENLEVEYDFANLEWANTMPIDEGTKRVVTDGMKILLDKKNILTNLINHLTT